MEHLQSFCWDLKLAIIQNSAEYFRLTYTEGDEKVDFLPNFHHITLPQETWQANLRAVYRGQEPELRTV